MNEAMSQGCAVVASDLIGAAPFLIEDGKNGLLFKSENLNSLYKKVKLLFDEDYRTMISTNAVLTMQKIWNPQTAAERFIHLSERLIRGLDTDYIDGPCSKV